MKKMVQIAGIENEGNFAPSTGRKTAIQSLSCTVHCSLKKRFERLKFQICGLSLDFEAIPFCNCYLFVSSLMCFIGLVDVHILKRQKDLKFCAMCLVSWMAAATTEERQVRWSVSRKALVVQKISINQSRALILSLWFYILSRLPPFDTLLNERSNYWMKN